VTDDTPRSKYAVYNKFFINTLIQLRMWQGPYSSKEESRATGVHSGEEGTSLIIFQFNKIIFHYFYFQLWLMDKWKGKKSFYWKKIFVFFANPPKEFPLNSPASRITELSNREQREETSWYSSNCISHEVTCTYALTL